MLCSISIKPKISIIHLINAFLVLWIFMNSVNCASTTFEHNNITTDPEVLIKNRPFSLQQLSPLNRNSPLLLLLSKNSNNGTANSLKMESSVPGAIPNWRKLKTKVKRKHNKPHKPSIVVGESNNNKSSFIRFLPPAEIPLDLPPPPPPPTKPTSSNPKNSANKIKPPALGRSVNFHNNGGKQSYQVEIDSNSESLVGQETSSAWKRGININQTTNKVMKWFPTTLKPMKMKVSPTTISRHGSNFHASPLISVGVETINSGHQHDGTENMQMQNLLKYGYHPHTPLSFLFHSTGQQHQRQHPDYITSSTSNNNSRMNSFNIMELETEYNAEAVRLTQSSNLLRNRITHDGTTTGVLQQLGKYRENTKTDPTNPHPNQRQTEIGRMNHNNATNNVGVTLLNGNDNGNDGSDNYPNFHRPPQQPKSGSRRPKNENYQGFSKTSSSSSVKVPVDGGYTTVAGHNHNIGFKKSPTKTKINEKNDAYGEDTKLHGDDHHHYDSLSPAREKAFLNKNLAEHVIATSGTDNHSAGGQQHRAAHVHYYYPPPTSEVNNPQQVKVHATHGIDDVKNTHTSSTSNGPSPSEIAGLVIVQLHQNSDHQKNVLSLSPAEMSTYKVTQNLNQSQTGPNAITNSLHDQQSLINYDHHHLEGNNEAYSNRPKENNNGLQHQLPNYYHHDVGSYASSLFDSFRSHSEPVHSHTHSHSSHSKEKEEFEFEEGRITIAKVMLGSKYLKKGTILVILAAIMVTLILAGMGAAGASLSPIIFPIVLLPIAIIAFILFIPSIILFVPVVIAGLAGGRERRRRVDDFPPGFANGIWTRLSGADEIQDDLDSIISNYNSYIK